MHIKDSNDELLEDAKFVICFVRFGRCYSRFFDVFILKYDFVVEYLRCLGGGLKVADLWKCVTIGLHVVVSGF
ncbi:hypothetical protein QVD17_00142 [Tagetes erecta]|uniref:Uncharacterized protein n=1 Tax=Tagetes erecta TaxID=13708 RepID=A0AAD8P6Y6_TARER|nr:hypothetical protein QVD17_00142 [Tagetes erecta]